MQSPSKNAGGFGSYLLGMSRKIYELSGVNTEANSSYSVKEPALGWMTAFLFVVCFVGLFVLIPLRKVFLFLFFYNFEPPKKKKREF